MRGGAVLLEELVGDLDRDEELDPLVVLVLVAWHEGRLISLWVLARWRLLGRLLVVRSRLQRLLLVARGLHGHELRVLINIEALSWSAALVCHLTLLVYVS